MRVKGKSRLKELLLVNADDGSGLRFQDLAFRS